MESHRVNSIISGRSPPLHSCALTLITMWGHQKCSFQKESVVCGRRIGIRKGSGDIVYDPRPEDPIVQFKLPGKQAREE